ncbi:bifunctional demethylmenaquinone methyltransferase/2-methoxy-6-polyprenyl-1,4-benzoquinol methylase UbiE [Acidithiobacillus thiooxidans]|uniref:Ubiquinone/menaquinone biosynthesis C-methyltransferase UbiE n=1 Tax=Acidithiobacillus thiooxidans ATCC 19377 TaxID=637390 RepID=A0A5P9XLQ9_ACITH|nr:MULTISPECIES: bifunctional demethylmenaquinone methyltransferase/2-methoxy-6-polyprenyl-1,4-benzoquinol methylase UbiE [Acidithiobacillus]MBU2742238.1 bifunctional demethylmenaquinone methyltransferase/2-methoxy-6-polyprenyl-1,4-benzoquinol methylase UbiE [Acidithiobacillus albertensis]MBU2836171.1 bifunctional demethylmenaquinone methyltransferase/2-methoxy-6-polyprenyl-1,4-benzoquinol methylase UbiE [Acidithiobacillus thiooxidans]QFX94905.1 bifunctional demethylmenaquinone methyltransferase
MSDQQGEDMQDQALVPTTHFGYQEVPETEKEHLVKGVFSSVAGKYDLMNDLMSLGVHRLWKRFTVDLARPRPGQRVLDLAGGTGDLAAAIYPRIKPNGSIVVSDINPEMLAVGENRLADRGIIAGVEFVEANAEELPFPDREFDLVTLAFGIRNMTHPERALKEIHRVLKTGGRALILEFSHPRWPGLQSIYDLYSFKLLPRIGELVARDRDSYQYLVESIRRFPDQETFKMMMEEAGLERVDVFNLSGGIVALHRGFRMD